MEPEHGRIAFTTLYLDDWRQFDSVEIQFHPRLTVLTGANASGKSTVLNLLAKHFNWSRTYSTTPISARNASRWSAVSSGRARKFAESGNPWTPVGLLGYSNGAETQIAVTSEISKQRSTYDLLMFNQQPIIGLYLTSHRSISQTYVQVESIPTLSASAESMFDQFTNEVRTRWMGGWTGKSPQQAFKESLISLALFGPGNEAVEPNPEAQRIWVGFNSILRSVLPPTLGFRELGVRVPDLLLKTATGDFLFDDASGGVSAIVELAWQIFLRSRNVASFTVLLDEPENHLHPSLQRELLPRLMDAFPHVQFIVATHSPFVVTSTPYSAVYALDYNDANRVFSRELDYANKADSADKVLTSVLGLSTTMPRWAQSEYDQAVEAFLEAPYEIESVHQLQRRLNALGMSDRFAVAVAEADQIKFGR